MLTRPLHRLVNQVVQFSRTHAFGSALGLLYRFFQPIEANRLLNKARQIAFAPFDLRPSTCAAINSRTDLSVSGETELFQRTDSIASPVFEC